MAGEENGDLKQVLGVLGVFMRVDELAEGLEAPEAGLRC